MKPVWDAESNSLFNVEKRKVRFVIRNIAGACHGNAGFNQVFRIASALEDFVHSRWSYFEGQDAERGRNSLFSRLPDRLFLWSGVFVATMLTVWKGS